MGADPLRPSPELRPSLGSLCVQREAVSCAAHATPPRRPRGPVLPRSQSCGGCPWATGSCTRRADPADQRGAPDDPRTLTGPGAPALQRAVPRLSASSRQRVRPRRPHWPRAPRPPIGPRSLFYIDRSGPIGAWRLLNMHASRQSASAGAGPPRAVAKLGLLNCYYRGGPIGTELSICQHSRPGPRRSASSYWPRPGPPPAPGAGVPAPIGCAGRRSPLCVNLRARGGGWRLSAQGVGGVGEVGPPGARGGRRAEPAGEGRAAAAAVPESTGARGRADDGAEFLADPAGGGRVPGAQGPR